MQGGPLHEYLHLLHPGEAFDPVVLADDPDAFAELKVKEIKTGCLAVFFTFGYYVQAIATGEGPVESWAPPHRRPIRRERYGRRQCCPARSFPGGNVRHRSLVWP